MAPQPDVRPNVVAKAEPIPSVTPAAASASVPAVTSVPPSTPLPTAEAARAVQGPENIDVAGVRLGMSPDQVRTVLKSRMLANFLESTETLASIDAAAGPTYGAAAGRYVNEIAAWSPATSSTAGALGGDGESYEVMFTPVPGKERVMAIVHSVSYSPARAIRTSALQAALLAKYGGYAEAGALTDSPTWRLQSDESLAAGDSCGRRGIFGGLAAVGPHLPVSRNLALRTAPEEFRYQIEHCGLAIITEDHAAADGAPPRDPEVAQFTVAAYSPAIAFDGATAAAQMMQASGRSSTSSRGPGAEQAPPSL